MYDKKSVTMEAKKFELCSIVQNGFKSLAVSILSFFFFSFDETKYSGSYFKKIFHCAVNSDNNHILLLTNILNINGSKISLDYKFLDIINTSIKRTTNVSVLFAIVFHKS